MRITVEDARQIIGLLSEEFDSHAFIFKYIDMHENDYIDELAHNNGRENVFRKVNAEIGKFLLDKQNILNIEKTVKHSSKNIKGNDTENQCWRRRNHV